MKNTSKQVTISVRTVGQSFGCEGILRCGSRVIWTSRVYPFGFRANAYTAAEDKAKAEGWAVR
jgi:hypothetical protein